MLPGPRRPQRSVLSLSLLWVLFKELKTEGSLVGMGESGAAKATMHGARATVRSNSLPSLEDDNWLQCEGEG